MDDSKLSLLVVDDSKISRKLLIEAIPDIIKNNMDIIEASNGKDAVQFYQDKATDLVFLDITMPDMDGYEVMKALIEHDPSVNVVMISADASVNTKVTALHLGAKNILLKPIKADDIRSVFLELMQ